MHSANHVFAPPCDAVLQQINGARTLAVEMNRKQKKIHRYANVSQINILALIYHGKWFPFFSPLYHFVLDEDMKGSLLCVFFPGRNKK